MLRSRPYAAHQPAPTPIRSRDADVPRLTSFRHYLINHDELDDVDSAKSHYDAYKTEYFESYHKSMFDVHRDLALLRDRFHPESILRVFNETCIIAKRRAANFISNVDSFCDLLLAAPSVYDGDLVEVVDGQDVASIFVSSHDVRIDVEKLPGGETEQHLPPPFISGPPFFAMHPSRASLVISNVPSHVSRWDVISFLETRNVGGVAGVACVVENLDEVEAFARHQLGLREKAVAPRLSRNCYIAFTSIESCERAEETLQWQEIVPDFVAEVTRLTTPAKVTVRVMPTFAWATERVEKDLEQSKSLMRLLDERYGMDSHWEKPDEHFILKLHKDPAVPMFRILDLQILYLRYVHNTDYYSGRRFESLRELTEAVGVTHLRPFADMHDESLARRQPSADEEKIFKRLDSNLADLAESLQSELPIVYNDENEVVMEEWAKEADIHTLALEEDRCRCGLCEKLFKGKDFVTKHIKNKHPELLDRVKDRLNFTSMIQAFQSSPEARWLLPLPFVGQPREDREILSEKPEGPQRRHQRPEREYRDWDRPLRPALLSSYRTAISYDDL